MTPPARRGLRAALRGAGARRRFPGPPARPPAWSTGVWLGPAPHCAGRPSPAASLSPQPLLLLGVRSGGSGMGWDGGREKSWPRRKRSVRAQLCILRSRPPSSLSCRCPCCSCWYRCLGAPLSWVACLGLPSELTSSPPPSLPPFAFFFFLHLFNHIVGVGKRCRYSFYKSKNRFLSVSFSLKFPVYNGKVQA